MSTISDSSRLADTATVTEAVAVSEPEVAVIVAEPVAIPVTSPADETVVTDEFDVPHVTVAPSMTSPFAAVTVAVTVTVSPACRRNTVAGESVIDVAV